MSVGIRNWLANNAVKYWILMIWILVNAIVFWQTYNYYKYDPRFFYLHQILGAGLCISRGTAMILNLNCCFVILPVCRALMTFLRAFPRKVSWRSIRMIIDRCKGFHIMCAFLILIASVTHYASHMMNALSFTRNFNFKVKGVNAASSPDQDPIWVILGSVPGVSGLLMMAILIIMFSSSTYYVRYSNYEVFWTNHRLYVAFYLLIIFHSFKGILKKQINISTHTPGCKVVNSSLGSNNSRAEQCLVAPKFETMGSVTWMWIIGPILIYSIDAVYRLIRFKQDARVVGVVPHPNNIVEIKIVKDGFKAKPGQFVIIRCPKVSNEWHPISISSVPTGSANSFTLHLKATGDWSGKMRNYMIRTEFSRPRLPLTKDKLISTRILIDGPFGGPSDDLTKYRVSVSVAGGIGVTPFIALFDSFRKGETDFKLERLYFIWVMRDARTIQCFADILCSLYSKLWNHNQPDAFVIRIYITSIDKNQEEYVTRLGHQYPVLSRRINFGRPSFNSVFQQIAETNYRREIGVFSCGPKSLAQNVAKCCDNNYHNHTTFYFHHESF